MQKRLVLKFKQTLLDKPILYRLVKEYDLKFNILKASITPQEQGILVVDLAGETDDFEKAMKYLEEYNVGVENMNKDIDRIEEKCTHCGACIAVCPSKALVMNKETWEVEFKKEKCIGCELCIKVCPPRAMKLHF